jgi:RNA polymerase sigma-70 factor, ECF subfamily
MLPEQQHVKNFRSWLYRVARNTWIDARRKPCPTETRPEEWWNNLPDPGTNPALKMADREIAERLWRNVQHLDEEMKNVIVLHYYQGLSLRETAEVLEISASTVKNRLREAIAALRNRLGPELNPGPQTKIMISGKEI